MTQQNFHILQPNTVHAMLHLHNTQHRTEEEEEVMAKQTVTTPSLFRMPSFSCAQAQFHVLAEGCTILPPFMRAGSSQ
jgi:hypothetical protein